MPDTPLELPERRFGSGFRALVVDDDPDVRAVVLELLEAAAFDVQGAADLKEARELVDSRAPDLVVTDKNLPDGSGLELARYLANQRVDCEVVMITAFGNSESAFEAFELGLADFVPKPFRDLTTLRRTFRKALERLLRSRRAPRAASAAAAPALPSSESQRRLRFFVELRARFILVDGSLTGPAFVSQLSTTDLFVETDRPLPIGTRVRLRLYIPGQTAVDLRAVVRRHGDGSTMLGMRLAFTDPSDEALAAISTHLAPSRRQFVETGIGAERTGVFHPDGDADASGATTTPASTAPPPPEGDFGARFTPDALRMFLGMQGPRVLDLLDTMDTETVQALLDLDNGRQLEVEPAPARVPAPFEKVQPALFDPENAEPEDLPISVGVSPADPMEPVDEEERLRRKYGFSDNLFEGEQIRKKYGIDESLFGDDGDDDPDRSRGESGAAGSSAGAGILAGLGKSPEQRAAFAKELLGRGEDALKRGLVQKAAADLNLAVAFAPEDAELRALSEKAKNQANAARAQDLFRQGLQQNALGDGEAAAKLLLGACELSAEAKYVLAAVRVMLQGGEAEAARKSRSILRTALQRDPGNADLHVLYGKTAEIEGFPKAALRSYKKALELAPDHEGAKESLAHVGED